MLRALSVAAFVALMLPLLAAPAVAVPGGPLRTLPSGKWRCETPGDAVLPAVAASDQDFITVPDSSYRPATGEEGTYLVVGDMMTMTAGAWRGRRFRVDSDAMVHRIGEDGKPLPLRCVRAGAPVARGGPAPAG